MDVTAAILPQRLLFHPQVCNPPYDESDCIINQLNQQHKRELPRLRDEHLMCRCPTGTTTPRSRCTTTLTMPPFVIWGPTGTGLKLSSKIGALRTSNFNARPTPLSCRTCLWWCGCLVMFFRFQDVSASRVHSTLLSLIPRDRFALLPAHHELYLPSVPLVVTIATMLGIAPPNWKELQRSLRAERVVHFYDLPPCAAIVCYAIVLSASAPVLLPPHVLPTATLSAATPQGNPKGGSAESLPLLLQWLSAVLVAREPNSAKPFHLFMNLTYVTQTDCLGLAFPTESLNSQWDYLMRKAAKHPTWGSAVRTIQLQQSMQPS